jgi:hypothetical protein
MAIRKKVPDNRPHVPANATRDVTVPSFSFPPTNALAQVIVDVWANPGHILDRDAKGNPTHGAVTEATAKIQAAGFDLDRAVIITEQEHDDDYTMQDPDEVVFVLPRDSRVINNPTHLLDTAKLLMACTPNGI